MRCKKCGFSEIKESCDSCGNKNLEIQYKFERYHIVCKPCNIGLSSFECPDCSTVNYVSDQTVFNKSSIFSSWKPIKTDKKTIEPSESKVKSSVKKGTYIIEFEKTLYLKFDGFNTENHDDQIPYILLLYKTNDIGIPKLMEFGKEGVSLYDPPKDAIDFFNFVYEVNNKTVSYDHERRTRVEHQPTSKYSINMERLKSHHFWKNIYDVDNEFVKKCSKI